MSAAMPVSKATNAYELLEEIKALALEEPKRISMGHWSLSADGCDAELPSAGFPVCGTVGCIGGWTEALTSRSSRRAAAVLGLDYEQEVELFYDGTLIVHGVWHGQTAEHAEKVAAHITNFQHKYEAQLKAKVIPR